MSPKACPIAASVPSFPLLAAQQGSGKGKNAKGKDAKGTVDKSKLGLTPSIRGSVATAMLAMLAKRKDAKSKDGKGTAGKYMVKALPTPPLVKGKDDKGKDRKFPMKAMPHEKAAKKASTKCLWTAGKSKDGKDDLIIVNDPFGYGKSKDGKDEDSDDSWGDWGASGFKEPASSSRSSPY
jgi:hypothetical protein